MGICTRQRLKNIGLVTGPGGLFCDKACNRIGGFCDTLPATNLLKSTVLYTEARDKGLSQRARDKGLQEGGYRDKPLFRGTAICNK